MFLIIFILFMFLYETKSGSKLRNFLTYYLFATNNIIHYNPSKISTFRFIAFDTGLT